VYNIATESFEKKFLGYELRPKSKAAQDLTAAAELRNKSGALSTNELIKMEVLQTKDAMEIPTQQEAPPLRKTLKKDAFEGALLQRKTLVEHDEAKVGRSESPARTGAIYIYIYTYIYILYVYIYYIRWYEGYL
jgi:hypothetical protein